MTSNKRSLTQTSTFSNSFWDSSFDFKKEHTRAFKIGISFSKKETFFPLFYILTFMSLWIWNWVLCDLGMISLNKSSSLSSLSQCSTCSKSNAKLSFPLWVAFEDCNYKVSLISSILQKHTNSQASLFFHKWSFVLNYFVDQMNVWDLHSLVCYHPQPFHINNPCVIIRIVISLSIFC
jgi:hypothetical protein